MDFHAMTNYDHSRRVSQISGILAGYAGYSPEEADTIRQAASFHDVGKCEIPPEILNKPGKLTEQEFAVVKTHTDIGHTRISDMLRILTVAALIASQRHEKLDGGGYHGLIGAEIHPYARLVAVADVFDALVSKRAYKQAWAVDAVLYYMGQQAGTQFDPALVALLLKHTDEILALYRTAA